MKYFKFGSFCKSVFLMTLVTCLSPSVLSAQNNLIVQQNVGNQQQVKEEQGGYYINGISTKEDIGGVEVSRGIRVSNISLSGDYRIKFRNYNNIPVSVIYEFEVCNGTKLTGTIVLDAGEEKETSDDYCGPCNFKLITRSFTSNSTQQRGQYFGIQTPNNTVPAQSAGTFKLGYIETVNLMEYVPGFQNAQEKMKLRTKEFEAEFNQMQQELQSKIEQYQLNSKNGVNEAQLKIQQDELTKLDQKIKQFRESATHTLSQYQANLMIPIQERLIEAIKQAAKQHGAQAVFEKNTCLYFNDDSCIDLSVTVKELLR
ncbi:OmpH family outer membrane protein [Bacteroides sp. KH569_7]|uniref:OmpH family outer membrane protein n=1 Tax=Bacteroides muris (ex Fokt et al. 2023) TaxID=2937417 RepID=A0A9X2NW33_9BACE|nr:OmpH family outer membrane protein [Bacteroides muris (ex Fokt et al. 2023)]MCR6507396.1 OmpH family outer membrane protein [Bacteroides muris (ex Fokt et al. 2023)]